MHIRHFSVPQFIGWSNSFVCGLDQLAGISWWAHAFETSLTISFFTLEAFGVYYNGKAVVWLCNFWDGIHSQLKVLGLG